MQPNKVYYNLKPVVSKISIIIPILNEEDRIVSLLSYLIRHSSKSNIEEIIVVDGGSQDNSIELVKNFIDHPSTSKTNISILHSKAGRAKQMNYGASSALGSILYFLHADSYPPKSFDTFILDEVAKNNLAGCFRMKFNSNHWWLKLAGWFTQFNLEACRGGDQSLYISKELFNSISGFDEAHIICEDHVIIKELYKRNQFTVIPRWLVTSDRLYQQHGVWKLQFHFLMIYFKKWRGASPESLYNYYLKHIKKPKGTSIRTSNEPHYSAVKDN